MTIFSGEYLKGKVFTALSKKLQRKKSVQSLMKSCAVYSRISEFRFDALFHKEEEILNLLIVKCEFLIPY